MVLVIQPCMFRYNLLRTMHQQEELHKHVEIGFVNVNSKIDAWHAAVAQFLLGASAQPGLLGLYHGRLEEIDATWTSIVSILASFWRTACRRKTPPAEQNWCSAGCGRSCCLQNHSFGSKAALHGQHKIGLLRR